MEEGNDIPSPAAPSPSSDHELSCDEDHQDLSTLGDPDLAEPQPPPVDQPKPALSDDLRRKIIKQVVLCSCGNPILDAKQVNDMFVAEVEYYFSDENLPNDNFLLKYVTNNAEGFVPVGVIASFRKMTKLTRDKSLIVAALKESSLLVVNSNGKKVKRLFPLLLPELKDPMACTVLVENLPEDHSLENICRVFGEAGNIKNITIRNPHDAREPEKLTVAEKLISGKLHALVEYDSVDAAEKAVATLNNEQDWRYGLRVKLLKKLVKDHLSSEKNGLHISKEKDGHKGQNRGCGRRQKYQGSNGNGRGAQGSTHIVEPSKPPPGPKMPDGTRGFTMGRGRPLC